MTHDELNRLEALANAATPGPWKSEPRHPYFPKGTAYVLTADGLSVNDEPGGSMTHNDAAFIAAARDAVPALVAEVRRLQQDAARWAFIRDSGQLAVKAMRLLDGSHITEGYVGGPYADAAVDAMIAKEERRKALEGA